MAQVKIFWAFNPSVTWHIHTKFKGVGQSCLTYLKIIQFVFLLLCLIECLFNWAPFGSSRVLYINAQWTYSGLIKRKDKKRNQTMPPNRAKRFRAQTVNGCTSKIPWFNIQHSLLRYFESIHIERNYWLLDNLEMLESYGNFGFGYSFGDFCIYTLWVKTSS